MITVDDVNSTLQRYAHMNMFHTINTALIGTFEFSDVHYDFVNVGHSISVANHTFTFEVVNSNWTGGFYVLDSNGDYLNVSYTYNDDVLSITTTESSIQLVLYCRHYQPAAFNVVQLKFKTDTPGVIYKQGYGAETCRIYYTNLTSSTLYFKVTDDYNSNLVSVTTGSDDDGTYIEFSITDRMWQGYTLSGYTGSVGGTLVGTYFFKISYETYTPSITVDNPVIVGKNNRVLVNAPKAGPYMKGKIYYKDTVVDLQYDSFDGYFFMLDLTDKNNDRDVVVTFEIRDDWFITGASFDLRLDCQYIRVADETNLLIELESGAQIVELSDDIQLTNSLNITHDVLILGNGCTCDVDEYSVICNAADVKINDIVFENGQPVFVQKKNSKLELTGCRFNSAKISSEYVTASVVYCDIDVESLSNPSDYVTMVTDCLFWNCENACIFHGGELSVTDSKYFCDMTFNEVYPNNPAFLYQVDGEASIIGSVFDIDTCENTVLCDDGVNLEYAQAIFMCGETATINNASYIDLNREDNVNFFNNPYNNLAHIFASYYYPKITDCICVSPTLGDEDKAICYCVSGVDWVFKKNVQVTRKSWGTENTTRKIIWEDI